MYAGILGSLHNIRRRNGFVKHSDIIPDRSRDLEHVLVHCGQGIHNDRARDLPALYAVEQHVARPLFVKPRHDFSQRAFAAAGSAHHGGPASRLQMHVEMFQQGRVQRTVAEAHILHGNLARQAVPRKGNRLVRSRIIQTVDFIPFHIVQPLHLHLNVPQGVAQHQQLLHRFLEPGDQVVEGHVHTGGHHAFHNGKTAYGHDQRAVKTAQQKRQQLDLHRPHFHFLGGHGSLGRITGPLGKELSLTAGGFDVLDHHDPAHQHAVGLGLILLDPHGQIGLTAPHIKEHRNIHHADGNTDQGQGNAVLEQQRQVEQRDQQVQYRSSCLIGQHLRIHFVKLDTGGDVRRVTLLEKRNRQAQHMPEEAGGIRKGQLLLPVGKRRRAHGSHDPQQDHGPEHSGQQFFDPFRVFQGKDIINKDLPHHRNGKSRQNHTGPQDHQESKSPLVLHQLGSDSLDNAVPFAFLFKFLARRDLHVHAGIGFLEFFPGNGTPSHGRVVQIDRIALESFHYQEMVKFPEEDQGKLLLAQRAAAPRKSLGHAALPPGGFQDIIRVAAVPGHAAFLPQHFQRQPAPVVGKYHAQGRGAALRSFHLQDRRHLNAFCPGKKLPDPFSQFHRITGFSATG